MGSNSLALPGEESQGFNNPWVLDLDQWDCQLSHQLVQLDLRHDLLLDLLLDHLPVVKSKETTQNSQA